MNRVGRWIVTGAIACAPSCAAPRPAAPLPEAAIAPDVVFVPTPQVRVDAMLKLAAVRPGERVYDLGCGDGRIPVSAARDFAARGVCVEIDPARIAEARANARRAGVEGRIEIREADLFETDFSDADVVTLFLLPELNERLRPKLLSSLRPGARVVSHSFDMGSAWVPDATIVVAEVPIFLWVIPERSAAGD